MILKKCEFCDNEIKVKREFQRFCNKFCQRKKYNQKPEVKEKQRIRIKEYRRTHPEWKEKHRILAVTKYKEKRAEYWKEYGKRRDVIERINKKDRDRRKIDKEYAIADRLRRSLNHALTKYSKTGKIMNSRKYGINWKKIIENLKPFPENLKNFEIDHIIPLHTFNLTDPKKVKKAFSPSNLQWLTKADNRKKSGKILIDKIFMNKMTLLKESEVK